MNYTLFISDLHLEASGPQITQCFFNLLKTQARQADAVYILGDLFEVWIGDDDATPFNQSVMAAIQALTATGIPVYFLRGNRDFLIGEDFCKKTGCQLLTDPCKILLYGIPIVLTHGDMLCTEDTRHQKFRHYALNPRYQGFFLHLPLTLRRMLARWIRGFSKRHTGRTAYQIMDVTPNAVANLLRKEQATQMIHGHTHRAHIHTLEVDGKASQRIVLGDWHQHGSVLMYYANGDYQLMTFDYL
ncbi:MAG TPA: UDP-2,3-diacylglucosamine diphosphatase [Gammaproteobacteria bacterium]|nr:UDP-2,3-diacylglucosamine diphosphatase [Gammaproteobacteria bacterium]